MKDQPIHDTVIEKLRELPPEYGASLLQSIREDFLKSEKTLVVLDDDPTGTQTSINVTVLTSWQVPLLIAELKKNHSVLFILTNSRSLTQQAAVALAHEIGANLKEAVRQSGREIILISRSDSTLRGHFPAEVEAISEALEMNDAATLIIPAFIEGGRYTINDIHFIVEKERLVPVSDTPFANDVLFGYKNSDLKKWVEEKTLGKVKATEVASITINDIRQGGAEQVYDKLINLTAKQVCVVNAVSYRDLEVVVMGLMMAEKEGRQFLFRTSATFVPIRAGMQSGVAYVPEKINANSGKGALIMVGSHVPKTTSQLEWLLSHGDFEIIEIDVPEILRSGDAGETMERFAGQTDRWLIAGKDVVVFTSRQLEKGNDMESNVHISEKVSKCLVKLMTAISERPAFIIAKGGITSSDLATKGLKAATAKILGPLIPGVPVWEMDAGSKFPGIRYVVFPGNVGDDAGLETVYKILKDAL